MVWLGRPYDFKFLKGCLPQILLDPFFNTLTQMISGTVGWQLPNNSMLAQALQDFSWSPFRSPHATREQDRGS